MMDNISADYFKGDVLNDKGTAQPLRLYGNVSVLFGSGSAPAINGTGGFTWYNNGESASNIQMKLSDNGNLGIGDSNPANRLVVSNATGGYVANILGHLRN